MSKTAVQTITRPVSAAEVNGLVTGQVSWRGLHLGLHQPSVARPRRAETDRYGVINQPVGLQNNQLDKIQRELLACCQLIQPAYFPILNVEQSDGRNLIVLWSPGGQNRPYKIPRSVTAKVKEYHLHVRAFRARQVYQGDPCRLVRQVKKIGG